MLAIFREKGKRKREMYNEVGRHYRCHRPRVMGSTSPKGKGDERNGWSSAMQSAYKVSLSLSFLSEGDREGQEGESVAKTAIDPNS